MSTKNKRKNLSQRILDVREEIQQLKVSSEVLKKQRKELIDKLKKDFKIKPEKIDGLLKQLNKEVSQLNKEIVEQLEQVENDIANIEDQ